MELLGFQKRLSPHLPISIYGKVELFNEEFFKLWLEWQHTSKLDRPKLQSILQQFTNVLSPIVNEKGSALLEEIREANLVCEGPLGTITGVNVV